ncbi:hypothetical protein G6F43_010415 [Rhizopus delemar]|nr:hypothetical protein G6F43_010415 [Rhizopus delemar]
MDAAHDLIAYAAGAVVVLYNHKRNKQIGFLYPPPLSVATNSNTAANNTSSNNPIAPPLAAPVSSSGANSENNSNSMIEEKKGTPARAKPISCLAFSPDGNYLAVGEMGHQPRIFIWDIKEKKILREFKSHKFGVLSLAFSPNMKYLVSVGFQHDGYLYVWDWKKGVKLAGNKGLNGETQVLDGRSGLLGVLRDANFVDVACDQRNNNLGYTYFVTDSGILCTFKEGRVLDKWVDLQVKHSFSIAVSSTFVICTCSEGIIRLFEPATLNYVGILPKPHPLGVDISLITSPDMVRSNDNTNVYPDSLAIVYDDTAQRVTIVYSDRSLYIWDIHNLKKIVKYRSFIYHSDCVWGIEPCPNIEKDGFLIPFNSFATFSGDGTIRVWNLDRPLQPSSSSTHLTCSQNLMVPSSSTMVSSQRRNIYSRELVKMIYVDKDASEFIKQVRNLELVEDPCPDFGIRSLKMSRDGKWMVSGDRNGNLRVHDMFTWDLFSYQEAHDSEILSIDVTEGQDSLIATGSRDRLLHIFKMQSDCQLVQTLDDHSSSITAVKFTKDATQLISSGADKGVIFRRRTQNSTDHAYTTYQNNSGRSTVFDMALDVSDRCVATVTGERKLYLFHVDSGKPFRVCKPDLSDEPSGGSLINIDLDPFSGTYAVTSGSDRCLRLFDLTNSTCIEKVGAHAEQITAVKFIRTNAEENGLRVVSTCSDSTIFVWKVSPEIVAKMCARGTLTPEEKQQKVQRIRRVSTMAAIRPIATLSQTTRKTFSSMSPAEHRYDEVYRKIEANRRRPAHEEDESEKKKSVMRSMQNEKLTQKTLTSRPDRLPQGYPASQKRNPLRPLGTHNKLMTGFVSVRQGKPPSVEKETLPATRKGLSKRSSQPALGLHTANNTRDANDELPSHPKVSPPPCSVPQEEDKAIHADVEDDDADEEEEEEDEDAVEEEEIVFTPEQEKVNKPFEVSTHLDTQIPRVEDDEEGHSSPAYDTAEEDDEYISSESNVDEDDILRSITSLEPPHVSASRSKIMRNLPSRKRSKRQSFTTKFLSSITNGFDNNQKPSKELLDAFKELKEKDQEPRTTAEVMVKKEMDPRLENALADLDGINILLDSVLDTLMSTAKTDENEKPMLDIEARLNQVANKITKKIPIQQEKQPETIDLLEKYSNLLLNMVESKLNHT